MPSYTRMARLFPDLRGWQRQQAYHGLIARRVKLADDARAAAQFNAGQIPVKATEQASRPRRDVIATEDTDERNEQVARDRLFQAALAAAGVQ